MVIDGIADALSATSTCEVEGVGADVVELAQRLDELIVLSVLERKSESLTFVADDEAVETKELKFGIRSLGLRGSELGHSGIFVVEDFTGSKVLDAGVVGDVGDEKGVDLSG